MAKEVQARTRGLCCWATVVQLSDSITIETYTSPENCRAALQRTKPESSETLLAVRYR